MKPSFSHFVASWRRLSICVATLLLLSIFSCQKQTDQITENESLPKTTDNHELPGFSQLLKLPQLSGELKRGFNVNDYYHYYQKTPEDKLWIVALKSGVAGFNISKIIVRQEKGKYSMMLLSYDYDIATYKKGDFTTYTGTISIYDNDLKKIKDVNCSKGKVIKVIENCPTCSLCYDCTPTLNWCDVFPQLCDFGSGGSGGEPPSYEGFEPPGDGGGDPVSPYPVVIQNLTNMLGLTESQASWLSNYLSKAFEIYFYLQSTSEPRASEISRQHIDRMMTDPGYLSFVANHALTGDPGKIWWVDNSWLSNHANFTLDITHNNVAEQQNLNAQELILVATYPLQAYIIKENVTPAFIMTDTKMGAGPGLNNKKDAFRHAYFQAINTRDVPAAIYPLNSAASGSLIVSKFGIAHESEVPTELILEKQMDLFNNGIGIDYCFNCWTTSNNTIADAILTKLNNGELRYLKPLDFTASPFWPVGRNGITAETIQTPTNQ